MSKASSDPTMIAVWASMADHFLDTETRHQLPLTALRCVQAGLSAAEARKVWQHEVSPAVGFNLLSVAGEWAFWDRDWLVERILRVRHSWWNRPGRFRNLRSPMRPTTGGDWRVIERSIELLQTIPCLAGRERMARDLVRLARHLFDLCPEDFSGLDDAERQRLRRLYPAPFRALMEPALLCGELPEAERRVQRAFARIAPWP